MAAGAGSPPAAGEGRTHPASAEEGPAARLALPQLGKPPPGLAAAPPGLVLVQDFVSSEEERELVAAIDGERGHPWAPSAFNGAHLGKAWGVRTDLRRR